MTATCDKRLSELVRLLNTIYGLHNELADVVRGKIEADPTKPAYVITVWGVGYKMAEVSE